MSEMRWNPVLGEWVVTATHRQDRTFLPPAGYCPLCPTKQGGFPTEVPQPVYDFVVFENKFPSLRRDPAEPAIEATELYPVEPSQGTCEVVLYSSNHKGTLAGMPEDRLAALIEVWKDRYNELGSRKDIEYVFIFENKGEAIGVTIHHPHGQIYAFSFIPPKVERAIKNEDEHHRATGRCLHCDIVADELRDTRRIVATNDRFVAFVPFYARYPYEVHLYAKHHLPSMAEFQPDDVDQLANLLHIVLKKYDNLWGFSLPYMMVMHQNPSDGKSHPGSHFRIEFYPPLRTPDRLKYLAGCESGAGTFVNDTLPEDKASELRRAEPNMGETGMSTNLKTRIEHLTSIFEKQFGSKPEYVVRAPGRVNLIGEHTDYNEGFVFPAAINREMLIAATPTKGRDVEIYSDEYKSTDRFALHEIRKSEKNPWADYLRGTLDTLQRAGHKLSGFQAVLSGNVPQGAGLSSSAAYEVAVATFANAAFNLNIATKDIALLAQKAENQFIGVQCGIMDQFISALAEADSALFIDCRSLDSKAVPTKFAQHGLSIVITNSGVRRGLVDSEYNARRTECQQGTEKLSELTGRKLNSLRDISWEEFLTFESKLPEVVAKRCRHVVSENHRVEEAVKALQAGDVATFGKLMNDSHSSLRDDFEVSCKEVDLLVSLTQSHPGVVGARMTGAGFGGCTVALMPSTSVDSYKTAVIGEYHKQSAREAEVYVCDAVGGARVEQRLTPATP